ncbi:E3 ubiquitin-protein ligase RHF2A-like isoform X2 [Salvia miltiorrhiza]|uniref:E3 ubiquitin-protein ligase RHF2A-like isoform X2 n=1 Tax=Salvia miltiorrhiza TaxID=226208 RepID=UPI0025ACED9E|nr:E3 ubiquitin-protein ligase RHF2A-like isoform X2 [Salvia miltiorrhiza]
MEGKVPGMDEAKKAETHMTSAAAFVEGGIQESCDDACSICLEGFSDSDPMTVTSCKHEFHLQCILEWCQRSSNCPMCWQSISLKDPANQELLEAVERERSIRLTPSRNATIFRHPTLGDFELQHLPAGINDAELQERIIQHLATAAAMGRTHRIARREGSRSRSSAHTRPQFVVFSGHPPGSSAGSGGEEIEPIAAAENNPSVPVTTVNNIGSNQNSASSSRPLVVPTSGQGSSNDNSYTSQSSLPNQDRAGPSELQSISDSWKSRFSSMSMKYKESISKSTKEWKDKLFSRSSSMADIGSEVRKEVNAGIATVSRMMERLESRDNDSHVPATNSAESSSGTGPSNNSRDTPSDTSLNGKNSASVAASSVSS